MPAPLLTAMSTQVENESTSMMIITSLPGPSAAMPGAPLAANGKRPLVEIVRVYVLRMLLLLCEVR